MLSVVRGNRSQKSIELTNANVSPTNLDSDTIYGHTWKNGENTMGYPLVDLTPTIGRPIIVSIKIQ